jgi:hypothetical protein
MELDQRIKAYNLEASDCSYRWWERSWYESFPIEKGGSQAIVQVIGHRHQILALGPLTLNNEGKVRFSSWRISFSHERDEPEKPKSSDTSNNADQEAVDREMDPDPMKEYRKRDVVFGVRPPRGNLITMQSWTLSGSIGVNFRIESLRRNGSSINGSINLIGYTNPRTPFIAVELHGYAKPFRDDYGLEIMIALVQF